MNNRSKWHQWRLNRWRRWQYLRRRLPYISADLKWMALWMLLLLAVTVVMTVADGGTG